MDFQEELINSGFVHRPLKDVILKSFDDERRSIKSVSEKNIPIDNVIHKGEGFIKKGDKNFSLCGTSITYCWPAGMNQDGDCAYYGDVSTIIPVENEDWTSYTRLRVMIKPECPGNRVNNLTVSLQNEGNKKIPDEYFREGFHVVELKNHVWNDCIWEFGTLPRNEVSGIGFTARLNGKDTASGENIEFIIKDIRLEKVSVECKERGWTCEEGKIIYPFSGYFIKGPKTAVTTRHEADFYIVSDDLGTCVYAGKVKKVIFDGKRFGLIDFSELKEEGRFHIQMGDYRTKMFVINDGVADAAMWKVLNFVFCERCGYPIIGKHGACHMDVIAEHKGLIKPFCGGWHDAGDLSQQLIQTAETMDALFSLAEVVKDKTILYNRLIEEACWGLEFVLKSRFGDGYRATSAGLARWTDGLIGNSDDVKARVHNHAFENLFCSYVVIRAAKFLRDVDPELSHKCVEVAKEDFEYGMERYLSEGIELPNMWEHTYNTSESIITAVIVLAASELYRETFDKYFLDMADKYANYLFRCQETKGMIRGFFYRDARKSSIVHFTHQSRDYIFVEALSAFLPICRNNETKEKTLNSIKLYGEYIKLLMEHSSPYCMIPAGVYDIAEVKDEETFKLLHLLVSYDEEKSHYRNQVLNGSKIAENLYLKQFPVWFSFRGNSAIHLSLGKAAGILGNVLDEPSFTSYATEQIYWLNGKNPFNQSLIYGEGERYASLYSVMSGEIIGSIPVGIETYEDGDEPYFPQANNATYKEVWLSAANRWMWTLAEILKANKG